LLIRPNGHKSQELVLPAVILEQKFVLVTSDSIFAMVENNDYFQFIFNYYSQTGLKRSSIFFHKCVALYVLYPLLFIFYFMVIFNFRYKHRNIFDFAEIFASISIFGNVYVYQHFKDLYKTFHFSVGHQENTYFEAWFSMGRNL
jgi:hypothetical protein